MHEDDDGSCSSGTPSGQREADPPEGSPITSLETISSTGDKTDNYFAVITFKTWQYICVCVYILYFCFFFYMSIDHSIRSKAL